MKVLVAGDFAPVHYRFQKLVAEGDCADILSRIPEITSRQDLSIVNFEATVADPEKDTPIAKCGPNIHTSANAVGMLKQAGFDLLTLANNHILDFGKTAQDRVIKLARENGLDTVGAGDNLADAAKIYYKKVGDKTLAVVNCCEHEFTIATDDSAGANPIDPVAQYYQIKEARSKADYVLVITHGGHEHFQLPNPKMQQTYRYFVDCGADAVVNHHQHCYSGYEVYRGKPIFYGLGNFCFDSRLRITDPLWTEGFMAELTFGDSIEFNLIPYTQCTAQDCAVRIMADRTDFDRRIADLNAIIADPKRLKEEVEKYYATCSKSILEPFEPYTGRYFRAAFSRGWLPSLFSRKKALAITNYVNCQAHLEKLRYALTHKTRQ